MVDEGDSMSLLKILSVLSLGVMSAGCVSTAVEPPIRFGVEARLPPFESRNDQGELVGLNIELARALCAELQTRCVWIDQDDATHVQALEAGKFDVGIPMTTNPAHRDRLAFTDELYPLSHYLVAPVGTRLLPFARSLKGKRIGVLAGTRREAFAQARWAPAGVTVRSFVSNSQLIDSLVAGEIDATLQDSVEIDQALLSQPRGERFAFAGPAVRDPLLGSGVAMAVRKADTALRDDLNAAFDRIVRNGQYFEIVQRYAPQLSPDFLRYIPAEEGLPFSEAVQVDETLYLSGLIGTASNGELVKGGIVPQMTQVMENLRDLLERNGSSMAHLARCTVILADIKDYAAMNEVYRRHVPQNRLPARTTYAVSQLVLDARVAVECIASTRA
jgi:lysine/arginine/ornithine transport system substrate-binding protein